MEVRWADESHIDGRGLLRQLVAELASISPDFVAITAVCADCGGPHGRPVVVSPASATRVQVSLARSAGTVFAAATWDRPIGIDAERVSPDGTRSDLDEAIAVVTGARLSNVENADLLLHWTRIEAVLKADGRGLRVDPRTVDLHAEGEETVATIDGGAGRFRVITVTGDPAFRVSLAIGD